MAARLSAYVVCLVVVPIYAARVKRHFSTSNVSGGGENLVLAESSVAKSSETTRFLSWNVYYGALGSIARLRGLAEGIKEVAPEIVSMQEICCGGGFAQPILDNVIAVTGLPWAWAKHDGKLGVDWDGPILYRSDIWSEIASGSITYDGSRGLSWAALRRRSDNAKVLVAGTHPICCAGIEYYLDAMTKIMGWLQDKKRAYPYPVVFMGDMNAGYDHISQSLVRNGAAAYKGRTWSSPIQFVDAYAEQNPSNPDPGTCCKYNGYKYKIDFVYAEKTPQAAGVVTSARIWDNLSGGSDHLAVSSDIRLSFSGTSTPEEPTTSKEPDGSVESGTFEVFGSGPCRGTSAAHNPSEWYSTIPGFQGTVADCQRRCDSNSQCKAIEYDTAATNHCELWTTEPQATSGGNTRWTCRKKKHSATTLFKHFGSGACRGTSTGHNPSDWYSVVSGFHGTVADCQRHCNSNGDCKAIEYDTAVTTHCELWTREPQATSGNTRWTCMRKEQSATPTPAPTLTTVVTTNTPSSSPLMQCEPQSCTHRNNWPVELHTCHGAEIQGTSYGSDGGVRLCTDCAERCWMQRSTCVGFEFDRYDVNAENGPGTCKYFSSIQVVREATSGHSDRMAVIAKTHVPTSR